MSTIGSAHGRSSYDLHEVPICTQRIIVGQQDHRLNPCLRDQKPVEGVLVNGRQLNHFRSVLAYYRQMAEAGRFDASQNFCWIGLELAEGALDADFPDRCGARKRSVPAFCS